MNKHGKTVAANGNLLRVKFEEHISLGEVGYLQLGELQLKAEVIEIDDSIAVMQVYEDLYGVKLDDEVVFTGELLEIELGPGLLASIFDGLQNPLEVIANECGRELPRGKHFPALCREKKWPYKPSAKVGDVLTRGMRLGATQEGRFEHVIMVPFQCYSEYTLTWVADEGNYTVDEVIAKATDAKGNEVTWTLLQRWAIREQLKEGKRRPLKNRLSTGLRAIDTMQPLMKGSTFCTPGPFGAGKTVLQHHMSKYCEIDIVVLVACGERAGEVVDVIKEFPTLEDPHTGDPLMQRTTIICNTSSMPVAARDASVYTGITIAEYYRQMGYEVLLQADSYSRWAQAQRETSNRKEEMPAEEGFPCYLASQIAKYFERAGVYESPCGVGSVTVMAAVSPAGGNLEEPVTQAVLTVVGAFLCLSRERSDQRRYPAIDPLDSYSLYDKRVLPILDKEVPSWSETYYAAKRILRDGEEISSRMTVVGEEAVSMADFITFQKAEYFDYVCLQQNAFDKEDAYCPHDRLIEVFQLMGKILSTPMSFESKDDARAFFMHMQRLTLNMNFAPFKSEKYLELVAELESKLETVNVTEKIEV